MPTGKDTEQLVIVLSKEVKEKLRKFGQLKRWSMSRAGATLIEEGLIQAETKEGLDLRVDSDKPLIEEREIETASLEKKPRVMSLAELFALRTLSDLIQENYYKLQENGKIGHQRLKKLASGERASQQERQIISQVLGIGIEELPED